MDLTVDPDKSYGGGPGGDGGGYGGAYCSARGDGKRRGKVLCRSVESSDGAHGVGPLFSGASVAFGRTIRIKKINVD